MRDLLDIENELKRRLTVPYNWGKKQDNEWDRYSSFIYKTENWDEPKEKSAKVSREKGLDEKTFFNYAANRWYNFWSSVAVERIFLSVKGVRAAANPYDKLKDFKLSGISFDHKTSVFPRNYGKDLLKAQQNPEDLIKWFYKNQSTQQRQHYSNRLFLVVYSENKEHWKLKSEISWLKGIIEKYVATFDPSQLYKLEFHPGKITLSDIIWAVK